MPVSFQNREFKSHLCAVICFVPTIMHYFCLVNYSGMWMRADDQNVEQISAATMKEVAATYGVTFVYRKATEESSIVTQPAMEADSGNDVKLQSNGTECLAPPPPVASSSAVPRPTTSPTKDDQHRPPKVACPKCNQHLSSIYALRRHRRNCKGITTPPYCHCGSSFPSRNAVHRHALNAHSGKFTVNERFETEDNFQEWFSPLCDSHKMVKARTSLQRNTKWTTYHCSIKSCAAILKIKCQDSRIKVEGYLKHGHSQDAYPPRLTKEAKAFMLKEMDEGKTNRQIIASMRSEFPFGGPEFCTTSRQVIDFRQNNRPSKEKKAQNDFLSVKHLVLKAMEEENCPFIMYKDLGERMRGFRDDQFFLGIMTKEQEDLLLKFGCKLICMDSTHDTCKHDLKLLTLMSLGPHDQGLPLAFLITTTENTEILERFFLAIRRRVGIFRTSYFMTDDFPAYYTAFCEVFPVPRTKLLCEWHFHRRWKAMIEQHLKESWVSGDAETKRVLARKIFSLFKAVQYLPTLESLPAEVDRLRSYLRSRQLYGLFRYFDRQYLSRKEQWMFVYRKESPVNTNMHLESFHRHLKYSFLSRCGNIRLDTMLEALFTIHNWKLSALYIAIERKAFVSQRMVSIAKHHRLANRGDDPTIIDRLTRTKYSMTFSNGETRIIQRVQQRPCCLIVCKLCRVCQHMFTCDCHSARFRAPICQHVHRLCITMEYRFPQLTSLHHIFRSLFQGFQNSTS